MKLLHVLMVFGVPWEHLWAIGSVYLTGNQIQHLFAGGVTPRACVKKGFWINFPRYMANIRYNPWGQQVENKYKCSVAMNVRFQDMGLPVTGKLNEIRFV